MSRILLSRSARAEIESKVDKLFDRLVVRLVGPIGEKFISFEGVYDPMFSLPGIFTASAASAGSERPDPDTRDMLAKIAMNYLDAERARAKANVVHAVENAVSQSDIGDPEAIMTALGGELSELWGKVTSKIRQIAESEATSAKNEGFQDGISKMSASLGISDPVVFKIVVKDDVLCKTCKSLWLMPDGITPRLYKMSELSHGYMSHKHPEATVGQSHPHCRCELTTLLPGYGFGPTGRVRWLAEGHDEHAAQRGQVFGA